MPFSGTSHAIVENVNHQAGVLNFDIVINS